MKILNSMNDDRNIREMSVTSACKNLKGALVNGECAVNIKQIVGTVNVQCGMINLGKFPMLVQNAGVYVGYPVPKKSIRAWEHFYKKELTNIDFSIKMSGKYSSELPTKKCKFEIRIPIDQLETKLDKVKFVYSPNINSISTK